MIFLKAAQSYEGKSLRMQRKLTMSVPFAQNVIIKVNKRQEINFANQDGICNHLIMSPFKDNVLPLKMKCI